MISKTRGNTSEFVHQQLLDDMQTGALMPGDKLTTESLAQRYQVSRTPVREALIRMERDGLLNAVANAGYEIRTPGLEELCDMYEIREALEGLAVEKLTLRGAPPELIAEMRRCCELRRNSPDAQIADAGERKIHMLICESCGSAAIRKLTENYLILSAIFNLTRVMARTLPIDNPSDIHAEHQKIIDAIEAGDAKLARKRLVSHIANARKVMMKLAASPRTPKRKISSATTNQIRNA